MRIYGKNLFLLRALIAGFALTLTCNVTAQTFAILHTFTNGIDGGDPYGALIVSGSRLYGAMQNGGNAGHGNVFALDTDGTAFTILYSFIGTNQGANSDGSSPMGGLVLSGNTLYGTATQGGAFNSGTVFKVNIDGTGFEPVYQFTGGNGGGFPNGGLVLAGDTLYGTAGGGEGYGIVFAVNTDGTGFKALYQFTGGNGGYGPTAGLALSGNALYGTTEEGGSGSAGTAFVINIDGTGFSTLHSFASSTDGNSPFAGVILSGNTLYGTTHNGGGADNGAVFTLNTDGTGFRTLFDFSAHHSQGGEPGAGLILSGNTLYGTTRFGGGAANGGDGTVFAINTNGTGFERLHAFMGGADGANPSAYAYPGVVLSGNTLYGMAQKGGKAKYGTVFSITLGSGSLNVTISPAAAITAGAQWQVDNNGIWQNSGATVTDLSVGNHTVSFSTIGGWTTPANQTVSIKARSVTRDQGTYTFTSQGIYNGLFMQSEVTEETAGMLSGLDVTASGTYTGKLLVGGGTNAISGGFSASGQASNYVHRTAKQGGPLMLEMTLNWNDSPPDITGTVSGNNGNPWVANLTNELAVKEAGSAEYTALLSTNGTPPGFGYLLITNHAGAVTFSGALADGTSFSQAVALSGAGDLPVYGNLYVSAGLLLGWIGLESGSPTGTLTWIKPASRAMGRYTNGFTNLLVVQGSPWTNPLPHTAAIDLPSGQLDIYGGSLLSPLSFNAAVNNNNAVVKLPGGPTNSLTGTINAKTGLLTITFGNGAAKATTAGTGAVLQNATNGGGFFLAKTNAGTILLNP